MPIAATDAREEKDCADEVRAICDSSKGTTLNPQGGAGGVCGGRRTALPPASRHLSSPPSGPGPPRRTGKAGTPDLGRRRRLPRHSARSRRTRSQTRRSATPIGRGEAAAQRAAIHCACRGCRWFGVKPPRGFTLFICCLRYLRGELAWPLPSVHVGVSGNRGGEVIPAGG